MLRRRHHRRQFPDLCKIDDRLGLTNDHRIGHEEQRIRIVIAENPAQREAREIVASVLDVPKFWAAANAVAAIKP